MFTDAKEVAFGIWKYSNVFTKDLDIINRLEDILGKSEPGQRYQWREALVGYAQRMPEYRDCVDFKYKKTDLQFDKSNESLLLQQVWQDCYDAQKPAVDHYCRQYNGMQLNYWESFNFIKYGPGQHFQTHTDHGFSYICVTSLVGYLNDDYDGGELYFPFLDLSLKPEAGDLFIFPSNYMYPHRAMPVTDGTKYSLVTMLDYNGKAHTPEFYSQEIV